MILLAAGIGGLAGALAAPAARRLLGDNAASRRTVPVCLLLGLAWGGLCGALFPPEPALAGALCAGPILALILTDLRQGLLHDLATLVLVACLVAWRWGLEGTPWTALLGGLIGLLSALALRRGHAALRGREGLGSGDVGLFAAAGTALTLDTLPLFLITAGLGGLAWGALTPRRIREDRGLPFAPALLGALALAMVARTPERIWRHLLEILGVP
jgi:leader peptidase (prepilin peptidase)/N-methyltransferase